MEISTLSPSLPLIPAPQYVETTDRAWGKVIMILSAEPAVESTYRFHLNRIIRLGIGKMAGFTPRNNRNDQGGGYYMSAALLRGHVGRDVRAVLQEIWQILASYIRVDFANIDGHVIRGCGVGCAFDISRTIEKRFSDV